MGQGTPGYWLSQWNMQERMRELKVTVRQLAIATETTTRTTKNRVLGKSSCPWDVVETYSGILQCTTDRLLVRSKKVQDKEIHEKIRRRKEQCDLGKRKRMQIAQVKEAKAKRRELFECPTCKSALVVPVTRMG